MDILIFVSFVLCHAFNEISFETVRPKSIRLGFPRTASKSED